MPEKPGSKAALFVLLGEIEKGASPLIRTYEIERAIDTNTRRIACAEFDLPIWKQQLAWTKEYLAELKACKEDTDA